MPPYRTRACTADDVAAGKPHTARLQPRRHEAHLQGPTKRPRWIWELRRIRDQLQPRWASTGMRRHIRRRARRPGRQRHGWLGSQTAAAGEAPSSVPRTRGSPALKAGSNPATDVGGRGSDSKESPIRSVRVIGEVIETHARRAAEFGESWNCRLAAKPDDAGGPDAPRPGCSPSRRSGLKRSPTSSVRAPFACGRFRRLLAPWARRTRKPSKLAGRRSCSGLQPLAGTSRPRNMTPDSKLPGCWPWLWGSPDVALEDFSRVLADRAGSGPCALSIGRALTGQAGTARHWPTSNIVIPKYPADYVLYHDPRHGPRGPWRSRASPRRSGRNPACCCRKTRQALQ